MTTNPLKTGDYIIHYYNRYGSRLKDLEQSATCLAMAQDLAAHRIDSANGDFHGEHYLPVSFVVDRRIFNSLDKGA